MLAVVAYTRLGTHVMLTVAAQIALLLAVLQSLDAKVMLAVTARSGPSSMQC
jgi:hypothetical protein